jgi:hypothetical protein
VGGNTNSFKIRVRDTGLCLMLDFRAPYRNGTRVIQYDCNARNVRSRWWYTVRIDDAPAPPGERQSDYPYMLLVKNSFTRKCLDADNGAGGAPPKAAVLQQWDCLRKRIVLDVAEFNERAICVYERVGFRRTGSRVRFFEGWGDVHFVDMERAG